MTGSLSQTRGRPEPLRMLVCGGRHFDDAAFLGRALDSFLALQPIAVVIEGGASGADRLARNWAQRNNIPVITEHADWHRYGRGAGPRRNQRMIDHWLPDVVVAFAGGTGTADMVERAASARIPVHEFTDRAALAALSPADDGGRDA